MTDIHSPTIQATFLLQSIESRLLLVPALRRMVDGFTGGQWETDIMESGRPFVMDVDLTGLALPSSSQQPAPSSADVRRLVEEMTARGPILTEERRRASVSLSRSRLLEEEDESAEALGAPSTKRRRIKEEPGEEAEAIQVPEETREESTDPDSEVGAEMMGIRATVFDADRQVIEDLITQNNQLETEQTELERRIRSLKEELERSKMDLITTTSIKKELMTEVQELSATAAISSAPVLVDQEAQTEVTGDPTDQGRAQNEEEPVASKSDDPSPAEPGPRITSPAAVQTDDPTDVVIKQLQAQHRLNITKLTSQHLDKLIKLQADQEKEIQDIKRSHERVIKSLSKKIAEEFKKEKDRVRKLEGEVAGLQATTSTEPSLHLVSVSDEQLTLQTRVSELERQTEEALEEARADAEARQDLETNLSQLAEDHETAQKRIVELTEQRDSRTTRNVELLKENLELRDSMKRLKQRIGDASTLLRVTPPHQRHGDVDQRLSPADQRFSSGEEEVEAPAERQEEEAAEEQTTEEETPAEEPEAYEEEAASSVAEATGQSEAGTEEEDLGREDLGASGEYDCPSEDCDTSFARITALDEHTRTEHKGKKLFRCDPCNKMFLTLNSLNGHTRREHGKTFSCQDCDKIFKSQWELKLHASKHQDKISCPKCEQKGKVSMHSTQKSLRRHIRNIHDAEPEDKKPRFCKVAGCERTTALINKRSYDQHVRRCHVGMSEFEMGETPSGTPSEADSDSTSSEDV